MSRPAAPAWARPAAAGLAGALGALVLAVEELDATSVVLIPIVALVLAAVAVFVRHLGAQLFARAAWWSNLLLGLLIVLIGSRSEVNEGAALAIGCGAALLLSDPKQLADAAARKGYRPAAHRGTLQLMMVLALADMLTLLLIGVLAVKGGEEGAGIAMLAAAIGLAVAFIGLYRLATWGVMLAMATALALGVTLATGGIRMDSDLVVPLVVLCALQVVVPTPMLVGAALKRPLPGLSRRTAGAVRAACVLAITLVAACGAALRHLGPLV